MNCSPGQSRAERLTFVANVLKAGPGIWRNPHLKPHFQMALIALSNAVWRSGIHLL
jgi:hypothetical protein